MGRGRGERTLRFGLEDAWCFLALSGGGGTENELRHILANGDYLQHGIFTLDELRTALAKLTFAGIVSERGGVFRLSPEARAKGAWCMAHRSREAWFTCAGLYLKEVAKRGGLPPVPASWEYPGVTREAYDRAYAVYHESVRDEVEGTDEDEA